MTEMDVSVGAESRDPVELPPIRGAALLGPSDVASPADPDTAVDPALVEAVAEALTGPPVPTSPHDPERQLGADPHDFAGLYLRHRSSFALHARRFLRDPRDVDEVVQEAFLRLFLALPELESELQALAYCRRTITNLCIDRYRADQRRPRLVDLESVPLDVLLDDEPDDPVIQAEDAAIIREALALLTPLHREALVKREIEEKSLPVIATELGVPEDSVKHLLHRARRALRRHLAATHLAPGADLDSTSTLSLLARSAVSGTGRACVLALMFLGLVVGLSTTKVPAQALETLGNLLSPAPQSPAPVAAPRPPAAPHTGVAPRPAPAGPPGLYSDDRDQPGPVQAPLVVRIPPLLLPASPVPSLALDTAATGTVGTRPAPAPAPTAAPGPSYGPVAPAPVPENDPVASLAPSPRPEPSRPAPSHPAPTPTSALPAPSPPGHPALSGTGTTPEDATASPQPSHL